MAHSPATRLGAVVGAVVVALVLAASTACYSPTLPLPPPARDGLTVSPPDEDGLVAVDGAPGVLDPGEQAVIVNRDTLYGWIVPSDDDGGFHAVVIAEAGHWLSIQRRVGEETGQAIEIQVPAE
jgi:hypothetical protein